MVYISSQYYSTVHL